MDVKTAEVERIIAQRAGRGPDADESIERSDH